jgi:hypothetical protein
MITIEEIEHKGLTILYTNLSKLSIEDAMEMLTNASLIISQQPLKSVYSMVNLEGMRFNKELIKKITEAGHSNAPYVKATAICGLTSMTKLIAKTVINLTGRKAKICNNIKDGKEWLHKVSQEKK